MSRERTKPIVKKKGERERERERECDTHLEGVRVTRFLSPLAKGWLAQDTSSPFISLSLSLSTSPLFPLPPTQTRSTLRFIGLQKKKG